MDTATKELIEAIKNLSPLVWEAAQQRVYANIVLSIVFTAFGLGIFTIMSLLVIRESHNVKEHYDKDAYYIRAILYITLAVGSLLVFSINSYSAIQYYLSPDWSAIELILSQVR